MNAEIGSVDCPTADAARRIIGRGRRVVLVGRSAAYLMVGTATVIGDPAQGRASQEKADQEIGEECSHRRGLAVWMSFDNLKPIAFCRLIKRAVGVPGHNPTLGPGYRCVPGMEAPRQCHSGLAEGRPLSSWALVELVGRS